MVISLMSPKIDFELLVDKHSEELFAYLWRMFGDSAEAQDCLQDTFLRAYRAYARLKGDANMRAWLYKIASNTAFTQLKRRGRLKHQSAVLVENIASRETPPDLQVEQFNRLEQVKGAVMALPHKQRAALMMRKYQEMSYKEISQALNCTAESARANVYQGLRKLRRQLAEEVSV